MELTSLSGFFRSVFPLRPHVDEERKSVERRLTEGEVWSLHPGRQETLTIYCRAGACWITQTGGAEDMLLHSGECRTWEGSGQVVIQALTPDAQISATSEQKGAAHVR